MKEMALLHAEGSETWEMATGPATIVGPDCFCTPCIQAICVMMIR